MSITLALGASVLQLPDDLIWVDEFSWQRVEQKAEYTITGALIVEASAKQAGQPITLEGTDTYGWAPRATVSTLETWKAIPGAQFALTLRGEAPVTVVMNHAAGAIDAAPIVGYSDVPDDFYRLTLRLLKV